MNTRPDWSEHYKSALVFPLRYANPQGTTRFDTFAFLAIDSKEIGAFPGMPEIFEYIGDRDVYHHVLRSSSIFQAGAAIADTLSMFLRPICIQYPDNK